MDDGKNCSSKKCASRCSLSVIALFIFMFGYDWLVHGKLLKPLYMSTPQNIWRPLEQMQAMTPWCLGFHFFLALVVTSFFWRYKNYSAAACAADPQTAQMCRPLARGMCFGTHLGLIFGLCMFSSYIWLPLPLSLGAAFFAAGFVKGLGSGLLLSLFCKKENA